MGLQYEWHLSRFCFGIATAFASCNALSASKAKSSIKKPDIELGDNVEALEDTNLAELWLETPENGAFRFDGNTFERFKP